jgi:hypothetical protein
MRKLADIGVNNVDELIRRIDENRLNEDLFAAKHVRLSNEAIDSIRKRRPFLQTLDNVDVPLVRQVGKFASAPQLLSRRRLDSNDTKGAAASGGENSSSGMSAAAMNMTAPGRFDLAYRGGPRSGGPTITTSRSDASFATSTSDGFGADSISDRGFVERERLRYVTTQSPRKKWQRQASSTCSEDWSGSPMSVATVSEGFPTGERERKERGSVLPPLVDVLVPTSQSQPDITFSKTSPDLRRSSESLARSTTDLGKSWASLTPPSRKTSPTKGGKLAGDKVTFSLNAAAASDEPSLDEVERLQRLGAEMARAADGRGVAPDCLGVSRWSCKSSRSPLQQGQDMLREQRAIDERDRVLKSLKCSPEVGQFRSHVAKNIHSRLREEARREAGADGLLMQHQCMNIRHQLASMLNARRELTGLKSRVQEIAGTQEVKAEKEIVKDSSASAHARGLKERYRLHRLHHASQATTQWEPNNGFKERYQSHLVGQSLAEGLTAPARRASDSRRVPALQLLRAPDV